MSIKAKLAAAVQRANEDPKKGKYTKTITPSPAKPYMKTITSKPQPKTTNQQYSNKLASTITEVSKNRKTPMSPMPTLRPTSVSVSPEKRTAAPLAGQPSMGKTKGRR